MYAYLMGAKMEGIVHDVYEDLFVSSPSESEWGPLRLPEYEPGACDALALSCARSCVRGARALSDSLLTMCVCVCCFHSL